MQRYRFHCVGGGTAVFDRTGQWVGTTDGVLPAADAVARAMMAQGEGVDWSGRQVEAYDARGRCVFRRMFGDVVRTDRAS